MIRNFQFCNSLKKTSLWAFWSNFVDFSPDMYETQKVYTSMLKEKRQDMSIMNEKRPVSWRKWKVNTNKSQSVDGWIKISPSKIYQQSHVTFSLPSSFIRRRRRKINVEQKVHEEMKTELLITCWYITFIVISARFSSNTRASPSLIVSFSSHFIH